MDVKQLEIAASKGEEMPEGLNGAEQLLYLSFRNLYNIFRNGGITKSEAKKVKNNIIIRFKQDQLSCSCWEDSMRRLRELQRLSQEIKNSDNELCKRIEKIMEGLI